MFRGWTHTCLEMLMILYVCVCTCCVAHSSCRCCGFDGPTLQGETASELAPSSHTHPGANERNYAPSLGLRQAAQCRQTHPSCRKKKKNEHKDACTHQLSSFPSQVPADDETHRNIPTPSSFPLALCCSPKTSTPRVNLIGQCCPSERQACWPGKHCPLVGLVLTGLQPVSGSQFLLGWVSE